MTKHIDLWYTIGGEMFTIQKLLPDEVVPITPLHVIDSFDGAELFCNPWGNGSKTALTRALAYAADRASQPAQQQIRLGRAIEVLEELQAYLEVEIAKGPDSFLIKTLIALRGTPISEIQESVRALRALVFDLQNDQQSLRTMLDTDNPKRFFVTHDVIPRFGLVASGNLGLFEIIILIWAGVLAQAARNGNQFSLTIKPSIYDFLFHQAIQMLPKDAKSAFSRITWRSGEDIIPDSSLADSLINGVDGAIYFGNRNTLDRFRNLMKHDSQYHYFYYDHLPIMIVLPDVDFAMINAAARVAATLAYVQKGEACLSLQNVFVHKKVYPEFIGALVLEWRRIKVANGNPKFSDTLLSSYSRAHLEKIAKLRNELSGAVIGQVYPEDYRTDLIINHEISVNNWILATENAAPLLCAVEFSDEESLLFALQNHLRNSLSDKFIYSMIISSVEGEMLETVCNGLTSLSHRLEVLTSIQAIREFAPYVPGIPHCGGLSFLADMFGLSHKQTCYMRS